MKLIKRRFKFDAGHRVVDHESKCKNLHGHEYRGEVRFVYKEEHEIGFVIDFGDIKTIVLGCFDEFFDHGMILNGADPLKKVLAEDGKIWVMSYYQDDVFKNPTAENIVKEMLMMCDILFEDRDDISIHSIELYETINCSVDVSIDDITIEEMSGFEYLKGGLIRSWRNNL